MDKITIENIEMPLTRSLEVGGEPVVKETEMASGKIVCDVTGWRKIITASWEWVPASTLAELVGLVRQCRYVQMQYPDPYEGDSSGMFKISIGNQKVFKYKNGEPYWYNVELKATAQEVV